MEDNDGSSTAAHSAPLKSEKNFNFSEKLSRLFSRRSTDNSSKENDEIQENKISLTPVEPDLFWRGSLEVLPKINTSFINAS